MSTAKRRLAQFSLCSLIYFSLFAPIIFIPPLIQGCAGTVETRQAQSYRTLKSVQISMIAAMKVYGTAVVTGKVSVEKQAEIDAKYATYRSAFRLAVQAARNDLNAIPPADLQTLADDLQLLITSL